MVDHLTKEKRSWNMSRIRSKNTKPEILVRSLLHRLGYRFRLQCRNLPGNPDIVLPKYKMAIFVHGCFWHCHKGCIDSHIPKSNTVFWKTKLEKNRKRDQQRQKELAKLGWKVHVIWECETKKVESLQKKILRILPKRTRNS